MIVPLSPEAVSERLHLAATASGIAVVVEGGELRIKLPPRHHEEPGVFCRASLEPVDGGTRIRLGSAVPAGGVRVFGAAAALFAALIGYGVARGEGMGVAGGLLAAACASTFFGGVAWIVGVATAGDATARVRRFVREALASTSSRAP